MATAEITNLLTTNVKTLPHVLAGFDPSYNPDAELLAEIMRLSASPVSFFVDPYHLETNVSDVARLLDRLLSIRRELWELEAARQRMALSYISMVDLAKADAALSVAQSDSGKKKDVQTAADKRVAATQSAVDALESRHGIDGGALNFGQRIAKLRSGVRDDIESCHVRSEAIIEGLSNRYHMEFPRPAAEQLTYVTFEGAAHLDDWTAWHRQLSRKLESLQARASSFEISIPLTTARLVEAIFGSEQKEIEKTVDARVIDDIKAGRDAEFDLSDQVTTKFFGPDDDGAPKSEFQAYYWIPRACGRTAIQEVAVQVDLQSASRQEGWLFVVEIQSPGALAPVVVNVDTMSVEPAWISSAAITNRSARGTWILRFLSASARDAAAKQVKRADWPLTEVKLLIRMQGVEA